jgi:hypothetical protein
MDEFQASRRFGEGQGLVLENLALRRQLLALHAQQPRRRLTALHKLFWVALRTFWSRWTKPLSAWFPRIRLGEHRAFTANCSSWVSISRKGVSRDGSGELREIQIHTSAFSQFSD